MTFFTVQEFKSKYNIDISSYQAEMASEMIYSQVGLRYRDATWTSDTCPTAIKNASMEQLRFMLEYDIPLIDYTAVSAKLAREIENSKQYINKVLKG